MNSTDVPIGVVGRGRAGFPKTFVVDSEISRAIFVEPTDASYRDLAHLLGGTPITLDPASGRDLRPTLPTDGETS